MKNSVSEARSSQIFRIIPETKLVTEKIRGILFKKTITTGYMIETTSLYNHVMESADETTTPKGVGRCLHIRKNDDGSAEIWTWGIRGNHPAFKSKHNSEDEAEEVLFNSIYQNDFLNDDQRDCTWFETEGEAIFYRNERYAELVGIDLRVAASILRKKDLVQKLRNERIKKPSDKIKADEAALAAGYENILQYVPGERYDDTCARLIKALPERLDAPKFHAIVRTLRREWLKSLPAKFTA